jgi:hypothetical protein
MRWQHGLDVAAQADLADARAELVARPRERLPDVAHPVLDPASGPFFDDGEPAVQACAMPILNAPGLVSAALNLDVRTIRCAGRPGRIVLAPGGRRNMR